MHFVQFLIIFCILFHFLKGVIYLFIWDESKDQFSDSRSRSIPVFIGANLRFQWTIHICAHTLLHIDGLQSCTVQVMRQDRQTHAHTSHWTELCCNTSICHGPHWYHLDLKDSFFTCAQFNLIYLFFCYFGGNFIYFKSLLKCVVILCCLKKYLFKKRLKSLKFPLSHTTVLCLVSLSFISLYQSSKSHSYSSDTSRYY